MRLCGKIARKLLEKLGAWSRTAVDWAEGACVRHMFALCQRRCGRPSGTAKDCGRSGVHAEGMGGDRRTWYPQKALVKSCGREAWSCRGASRGKGRLSCRVHASCLGALL